MIWFNPPYNSTVSTNIGHKFLQAMDEYFPSHHPLHKIFNRNTLKLSYSCMPNVKCLISSHNKSIINKQLNTVTDQTCHQCNRCNKNAGPLQNKCLTSNVTRKDTNERQTYVGHSAREFKTRYKGYTSYFGKRKYKYATELSKFV